MFAKLWKQWKNSRDDKQLAEYAARDAELGTPTKATLEDRAADAARKGLWKTAIAAVDAGADVNMAVDNSFSFDRSKMEYKRSLALFAAEQNNAEALSQLLDRGASQSFVGSVTVTGSYAGKTEYTVLEFAVLQGAKECVEVLLKRGGNPQSALDGALKIAAREKSYIGMASSLLDAGAKGFEAAQREAEVHHNDKAIPLIKGAAKKAFDAAQASAAAGTPAAPAPVAPGQQLRP
jgi:ankyrin repeat protein